jgi:anti-sigma factor RsiW
MAEFMGSAEQAALWRLWCDAAGPNGATGAEPDAMTLAAYAEGRLPPEAADAVEDWLALNPTTAADVLAARRAIAVAAPAATDAVIARAAGLVGSKAEVLAFRRPGPRIQWRRTAAWGAMAASILLASLAGFATGSSTYARLEGDSQLSVSQQLLDPPIGLFDSGGEDTST